MSNKQNPKENTPPKTFSTSKLETGTVGVRIPISKSTIKNWLMGSKPIYILSASDFNDVNFLDWDFLQSNENEGVEEVFQNSDLEQQSLTDELIASWKQANQRIEEAQKAIQISKIETRVMLDYLKEITIDVG